MCVCVYTSLVWRHGVQNEIVYIIYSALNGVADVDQYEGRESAGAGPVGPTILSPPAVGNQDSNGIPLEQLKQMLSSQLEYYFSRFVTFFQS